MTRRMLGLTVAALLGLGPAAWAAEGELVVSAAASLTNAFRAVGQAFERANPGSKVTFNFAASGTLLQQLDKGAPVDVFAPAGRESMDRAEGRGLVERESRRNFARNRLVLVVPSDSKLAVGSVADLARPEVRRIAVGDPAVVPAGQYTRQSLRAARLWDALAPKYIPGNSVRQVLEYVSRGEVDAAFVFSTDAAARREKVRVVGVIPGHEPIVYPVAVVRGSARQPLARQFVAFVSEAEAQRILARFGFQAP